jgi:hypothetical protein
VGLIREEAAEERVFRKGILSSVFLKAVLVRQAVVACPRLLGGLLDY